MENPFADPSVVEAQRAAANAPIEEDNPFAEDVAPQPAAVSMPPSGQITGQMTPAPVTPSAGHSTAAAPIKNIESIPGHADLLKRQQELERKEAELERRERQMNVSLWVILFINELFKYAYLVSSIIFNSFTFSNISRQ